jgi:uncharacterized protein involved in oxidation of intracellular sulfur
VKILFVLNDPPYGTELSYNALRVANALAKREGTEVRAFLLGDAAPFSWATPRRARRPDRRCPRDTTTLRP